MDKNDNKFGNALKMLRKSKNLTQEQFAAKIDKTTGAIGQFERGNAFPEYETIVKIIEALDIDANLLFSRKDVSYPDEAKWIAHIISNMNPVEKEAVGKFLVDLSDVIKKSNEQK